MKPTISRISLVLRQVRRWMVSGCLLAGFSASVSAQPLFPTGTFTVIGSVRGYSGALLGADSSTLLQLVSTNGTVVADSYITDANEHGYNYRLEVPLSSTASSQAVLYGAPLRFIAQQGGTASQIALSQITAGDANSVMTCNVVMATYSGTNRVPDEYIAEYAGYIEANPDKTGGIYSDTADWDGDGLNNYAEFVAGTDPTDASDCLRISAIGAADDTNDLVALTFEYSGGRIYAIKAASELPTNRTLSATGSFRPFRGAPAGQESLVWTSGTTTTMSRRSISIRWQSLPTAPSSGWS